MEAVNQSSESFFTRQTAIWVSCIYLTFGVVYIYGSGWLVLRMYDDAADLARAEMYKGWGFILSSSILLYVIVHFAAKAIRGTLRREVNAALRYQRMIETTNEGVWKLDEGARTTFVNQTMVDMLGTSQGAILGKPEAMFLDEEWNTVAIERLQRHRKGERDQYECRFCRPDGSHIWALVAASPMHDADGTFTGVLRMVTDITKRKQMELALKESLDAQRQLLNELDHRVRNNLSSLISLVDISRGISDDPETFAASIKGRIDAMNRAHNLLSSSGWKHQNLRELLNVLVPTEHLSRVSLQGPDVPCPADISGALAIVFHELLANAIRHGALSVPEGHVTVNWTVETNDNGDDLNNVTLQWTEHGGPEPQQQVIHGAGLRLVSGLIRSDLRGNASFEFPTEGARHELTISVSNTSAETPWEPPHADLASMY